MVIVHPISRYGPLVAELVMENHVIPQARRMVFEGRRAAVRAMGQARATWLVTEGPNAEVLFSARERKGAGYDNGMDAETFMMWLGRRMLRASRRKLGDIEMILVPTWRMAGRCH